MGETNNTYSFLAADQKLRQILEIADFLREVDSPIIQNYAKLLKAETEGLLLMFALEDESGPLLNKDSVKS